MPILTVLAVAVLPAAQVPPAPPIVGSPTASAHTMFDSRPGAVRCDGGIPTAVSIARPTPSAGAMVRGSDPAPVRFSFSIDTDGRVVGIKAEPRAMAGGYVPMPDLQPALAASRFVAGSAQARCTIQYDVDATPLADAPAPLIRRYLTLPHDAAYFESDIRKRARAVEGDCYKGTGPAPLLRAYPDLEAIPQAPGTLSMTVAGFDLDTRGKPVRIRTIESDGNAALDAATRAAVAASRFKTDRGRIGCVMPMFRRQRTPLAAPVATPLDGFRNAEGCPADDAKWAYLPTLTFPEPFRRRGIEGWAIVRYDVAPWGQVGNVHVVASEPAAAFGDQARQIMTNARRAPSARGASGCVERVRFKLPEGDEPGEATPPPPSTPVM